MHIRSARRWAACSSRRSRAAQPTTSVAASATRTRARQGATSWPPSSGPFRSGGGEHLDLRTVLDAALELVAERGESRVLSETLHRAGRLPPRDQHQRLAIAVGRRDLRAKTPGKVPRRFRDCLQQAGDLVPLTLARLVPHQPHHTRMLIHFFSIESSYSFSGESGISLIGTPRASSMAAAITAPTGITPASPAPFTPSGLSGDGVSKWSISIGGISVA